MWATLLDEGTYLASISTMYRLLRAAAPGARTTRPGPPPRRWSSPSSSPPPPTRCGPGTSPSSRGPHKWTWFHLYVILDVYSRYAVAWLVATRESARLAEELIADAIYQQHVPAGQLTLHADRGTSMTSKTVTQLLADLGVAAVPLPAAPVQRQPLQRSQLQDAQVLPDVPETLHRPRPRPRASADAFFEHYNHQHRHSGIGLHTPADVHLGRADQIRARPPSRPRRRLRRPPRTIPPTTQRAPHPRGNMDQPTRGDAPGHQSHLSQRCLTTADTFRRAARCHTPCVAFSACRSAVMSA